VIVPVKYDDPAQKELADKLHDELAKAHVEVILDERDERPGFKFKDWELIGIPYIVTVGRRAAEGIVEFKDRQTMEKVELSLDEALNKIIDAVKNI
ncbi:MAG: hypothetical protein IKN46_00025, partial [Acholeplasmatales bacterium]|nr:hypothetical protein [Acholeplasmatales bacterium]